MTRLLITLTLILLVSQTVLYAGPNDTEAEEQLVKSEFTIWLNNSNLIGINNSDINQIIELYDDDYIRNVMIIYEMPWPSGDFWFDFQVEYFCLTDN